MAIVFSSQFFANFLDFFWVFSCVCFSKGSLISKSFPLWLKSPKNHNPVNTIHLKRRCSGFLFGDLSQNEILYEIKLPLVTSTLTLMSDAASNSCILRNGQKSQDFVASAIFTDCRQSNEVSHNFLPHLPLCPDFKISSRKMRTDILFKVNEIWFNMLIKLIYW